MNSRGMYGLAVVVLGLSALTAILFAYHPRLSLAVTGLFDLAAGRYLIHAAQARAGAGR